MSKWENVVNGDLINARVAVSVNCPNCDAVLVRKDDYLYCGQVPCPPHDKRYHIPTLPLVEVERGPEYLATSSSNQLKTMTAWKSRLLEMLTEMVAEFDGDGTDLYEHAQKWIVTAKEILPLAKVEWGE